MEALKQWFLCEVERRDRHVNTVIQDTVTAIQERLLDLQIENGELQSTMASLSSKNDASHHLHEVQILEKRIDHSGQALQKSWHFSLRLRERMTQVEVEHQRITDVSLAPPPGVNHSGSQKDNCVKDKLAAAEVKRYDTPFVHEAQHVTSKEAHVAHRQRNEASFYSKSVPFFKSVSTSFSHDSSFSTYKPFDSRRHDFGAYLAGFEHHAAMYDYTESDLVVQLWENVQDEFYHVTSDVKYMEMSYDEVASVIKQRIENVRPRAARQFEFENMSRSKSERITDYVYKVKHMAISAFPEISQNYEALMSRVNEKIASTALPQDKRFREYYLMIDPCSIEEAVQKASQIERICSSSGKSSRQMPRGSTVPEYEQKQRICTISCYRCEEEGHTSNACPEIVCEVCDETGHKMWTCPNRICSKCEEIGHFAVECQVKDSALAQPELDLQYQFTEQEN